jgi:small conductance mechanosensitive channel
VAADALEGIKCRDASRPVSVLFTGFGDSAIDLVCRFWILPLDQAAWARARSMAIQAIKQAFDTADIEIPFPIRQLDLPDDALVELHARQAA